MPPHSTTAKVLDYKTNITQNHQNIELYGSLTNKELKKSYSSRWVGRAETQRCVEMQNGHRTPTCGG